LRFLGTSGENILDQWRYLHWEENIDIFNSSTISTFKKKCYNSDNIKKEENYKTKMSWIEILERTLRTSHIAPTTPDTLFTYASKNDKLMLDECPNVYFAGNCPEGFQTKLIKENDIKCRLICIPEFHKSSEIILLDLTDVEIMNVETIKIDCENIEGIEWEKE